MGQGVAADYLWVLAVGLAAGAVSGVFGTGSSMMLLPVLVPAFGPQAAVPIMAVAAIVGNLARVLAWWSQVDWRAVAAYALPGMPAAALGARTLLVLPPGVAELALGSFFIAMVPVRRLMRRAHLRMRLWQLAAAGAVLGFVTGIVVSTGPLSVPAFAAYGLAGGAFLGSEAASSVAIYVAKVAAFAQAGALPAEIALSGLIVGAALMAGTFAGKRLVLRLSPAVQQWLIDGLLVVSGLALLTAAWQA